jgi:hypothetical protein
MCEKSLSHAGFCDIDEFGAVIATMTRAAPRDRARHTRSLLDAPPLAARRRPQDSLFFCCAVVIIVQCSSIRDCTASPVSSWLGGQNGEESKVEDEVRCEEDRAQDREAAQEGEEVTPRRREPLR